jgi:PAS domain S-box-containing protein
VRTISMEYKLLAVFLLASTALLGSALLAFINTHRLRDTADWVSHTYAVMEKIQGARAAALEAGSAIYRYVITNKNLFLGQSESDTADLGSDYAQLREMTSDNPIEQQHLDQLSAALKVWRSRIADVRLARQLKGFTAAQKLVQAQHISSSTTVFRIMDAMLVEEHRLLNTRLKEEHYRTNVVKVVYAIFCVFALTAFIIVYFQISREVRIRRQTESKFQMLFQSAADAIIVSDVDGRIVMLNDEAEKMFGYSRQELMGLAIDTLVPERVRSRHHDHRSGYIAAPQTRRMGLGLDLFARHKDGSEFPVDINLSPFSAGQDKLVVSRIRDMTQRQHAEDEIRNLNAHLQRRTIELETVNKELEAFSYTVSHDLRAPLRAVDGFSRLLEEQSRANLDAEGMRLLGVIRDNSRKMSKLIDALLSFSRLGRKSVRGTKFNMRALAEEALNEVLEAVNIPRPKVEIKDLPDATGDRALLKQVWLNLLSNAVKYTSRTPQPRICVNGQISKAETIYCVSDNGAGFDMHYAHKLFEVFQRLHGDEDFSGTGIGLATVKRVVVKHGGRVWAESEPGHGARFFFSLPSEGATK